MARPRFQFSLLRLLIVTAIIGGILACCVNFGLGAIALTIVWTALLMGLMVAALLAWVGSDARRPVWAGVAWFGWVYLVLLWAGRLPLDGPSALATPHTLRLPMLAVDMGLRKLYEWSFPPESRTWNDDPGSDFQTMRAMYDARLVGPPAFPPGGIGGGGGFGPAPGFGGAPAFGGAAGGGMGVPIGGPAPAARQAPRLMVPWELFRDMGHSLIAALWAILGGVVAWRISRRALAAPDGASAPGGELSSRQ